MKFSDTWKENLGRSSEARNGGKMEGLEFVLAGCESKMEGLSRGKCGLIRARVGQNNAQSKRYRFNNKLTPQKLLKCSACLSNGIPS